MRLINADTLLFCVSNAFSELAIGKRKKLTPEEILKMIYNAPTVEPVNLGRWIYYEDETIDDGGRCSICGGDQPARWVNKKWQYLETKYCPYCGARMDGETP